MVERQQIDALVAMEQARFIKNADFDRGCISQSELGPVAMIGDEEIPLMDAAFDMRIVQPGSVAQNPKLKTVKNKIIIVLDPENPAEEAFDEVDLLPVTIVAQGMRNFGIFGEGANQLICWSNNGVFPAARVPQPLSTACAELVLRHGEYQRQMVCPHALWDGDQKPACRSALTLGFFDLGMKIPVRMQLHGAALGAWNKFQQTWKQAKNVARLKKKNLNNYIIKLSVSDEGTYSVPVFKFMESDNNPSKYMPVCKYYMETIFKRTLDEQQASARVEAVESENVVVEDDGVNY